MAAPTTPENPTTLTDVTQERDRRDLAQPHWRIRRHDGGEQRVPVASDLLSVGAPRGLAFGDVNLVSGLGGALHPSRVGVGTQPLWCRSC